MSRSFLVIVSCLLALMFVSSAYAETLGKRWASVFVENTRPGDDRVKAIDDDIPSHGFDVNIPVTSNLDLYFAASYSRLDGETPITTGQGADALWVNSHSYSGFLGAYYHLRPGTLVNPYVGAGVACAQANTEVGSSSFEESDRSEEWAGVFSIGAELNFTKRLSLLSSFDYARLEGSDYDYGVMGILSFQVTDVVRIDAGADYSFEFEDRTYFAGVAVGF